MKKYGCIGKKLTHSFSKEIHNKLADYEYELFELTENQVGAFLQKKDFTAINVTIPYKETVIPYLDCVSDIASKIGAVNTIINCDGKLYGYNTDYYGMKSLIDKLSLNLLDKKVLILGTGGTSKTARVLAHDLGASKILTVSRSKSDDHIDYSNAATLHNDADIIINTTPLGMYPECDSKPIDLSYFTKLEGLIDTVYNPLRTNLVLDAIERGVKAEGGLYMLVMQAVAAVEKFLNTKIDINTAKNAFLDVFYEKENVVLIGMPSSGKSTVGKLLNIDGFEFFDTDTEIEKHCGCSIGELIATKGEQYFRDIETKVVKAVSSKGGRIIATGGGAVLREENVRALKQNGKLFFLDADIKRLTATEDRPLSNTNDKLLNLYNERINIYKSVADIIVPDMQSPELEADYILAKRNEMN